MSAPHRPSSLLLGLILGWSFLAATAPAAQPTTAPAHPRVAPALKPADFDAARLLVVHYRRLDDNYTDWNLWAWVEGQEGKAIQFADVDSFGRYAVVPLPDGAAQAGIIVRKGEWVQKDIDQDRFVKLPADQSVTEVWLVSGDATIYDDPTKIDYTVRLVGAFLDAIDRITFASSAPLSEAQRASVRVATVDGATTFSTASVEMRDEPASTRPVYDVRLDRAVPQGDIAKLTLSVDGLESLTVFARDVLNGTAFLPLDAVLGYQYAPEQTTFQTWSPVAEAVELLLYDGLAAGEPSKTITLTAGEKGLWRAVVPGDLHGRAYRYRFTSYGKQRVVPDIHCFAANVDSTLSVVDDLNRLVPDGWGQTPQPTLKQPTDEIIYEVHTRDFSIADASCPPALRGTYLGLVHKNPAPPATTSSGLSHLKDLGVTAIHLLPIHDFTAKVGEYNWGYWTTLFNVPESNYSTDPTDPTRAIVELRQVVQTMHANDIRVIMDVAYNHTSSSFEHSPFDQTVPYFYFRTTPDGRLMNDAGVGNSIADERPMVRKYIVDSLKFWVRQYRVDGFRFDLLGTHQPQTVRAICDELLSIRADLTLYGEPWTGGGKIHFGKGAQRGSRMAVFNDHLRGAVRGDLDGTQIGFATGPGGDVESLRRGIAGAIDDFTTEPIESINYVSAHDNLTLWDKLRKSNPEADDAQLRAMQKLAEGIVLTSQGIPFIHGGCDFARTKGGNHNSYNAPDAVNRFDWDRKAEYADVHDYVRGLIALRRALPEFRLDDDAEVRAQLQWIDAPGIVAYTLRSPALAEGGRELVVAYNGEPAAAKFALPSGEWEILVDAQRAGAVPLRKTSGEQELPGYSMLVAQKRR